MSFAAPFPPRVLTFQCRRLSQSPQSKTSNKRTPASSSSSSSVVADFRLVVYVRFKLLTRFKMENNSVQLRKEGKKRDRKKGKIVKEKNQTRKSTRMKVRGKGERTEK